MEQQKKNGVLNKLSALIKSFWKSTKKVLSPVMIIIWKVLRIPLYPFIQIYWLLTKLPPIVIGILSALVWGFGQFLNRQFIKAAIFFGLFALIIFVEFATGSYGQEFNLYNDKIPGDEIQEELSNYLPTWYFYNLKDINPTSEYAYEDFDLLHDVALSNGYTFNEDTLTFFDENNNAIEVDNVAYSNEDMYAFLGEQIRTIEAVELENGVQDLMDEAEVLANADVLKIVEGLIVERAQRDIRLGGSFEELRLERMTLIATNSLVGSGHIVDELNWDNTLSTYIDDHYETLLLQAEGELFDDKYIEIYDDVYEDIDRSTRAVYYIGYFNSHFQDLFGDLILQYDSVASFADMLQARLPQNTMMDNDDYNKMLARIYFAYNPVVYDDLVLKVDNIYNERAGFFVKGVWGLITMGSIPQTTLKDHEVLSFLLPSSGTQLIEAWTIEIAGHHSTQLLLRGIISVLVLVYVLFIYVWNFKDAYRTAKEIKETKEVPKEKEYFAELYENFFEYIVLTPALLLITFISVMPIFFGLAVAFTNYNIEHIPPGKLISWVGFQNFIEVFSITSGSSIDFGGQFWKVFSWTLIWATAATFTCFFGGFVQAVILNNKRVVFRKFWRSILILPWAMPALVSQMIFRVMFNDNGYVNQVLLSTGITQLFIDWGMLGRSFAEAGTGLQRLFYLGDQNFQWLSNEANPTFVKVFIIVLNVWLGFPFFMALMSGVMTSIDKSLYEAASIDGATGFQQFRYITMPLVLFATSPLLVMTFSGNFNNFGVIYFITGGGPGGGTYETAFAGSTDILISWIYTLTVDPNVRWYSMASVFSILIFLIIGTLSAWNFTRTRAFKEDD